MQYVQNNSLFEENSESYLKIRILQFNEEEEEQHDLSPSYFLRKASDIGRDFDSYGLRIDQDDDFPK